MKNIYSYYSGLLLLLLLLSKPLPVSAGHVLGTDIRYENVGPNQYLVSVRWYRDCMGLTASQQISVCYSSDSAGINGSIPLQMFIPGTYPLPNFPYLPPYTSSCIGGSGLGIEHITYQGLLTLPSLASDWIISYSSFPQNVGIGQNFMYVSTKIDNINYPTNSSSYFSLDPGFIYCINQPAWDNFISSDVNGDSLSYHQIPVLDNTVICPPAPFQNPIPPFPPLQSSTPITMDSTNGSLTFTPTTVGQAMVSVRVDEFRGGVLINSSTREHVMYLIPNCTITGLAEHKNTSLNLHPNPANTILIVDLDSETTPLFMETSDATGKISRLKFVTGTNNNYQVDISQLSEGIYTLRVVTENTSSVTKFAKL